MGRRSGMLSWIGRRRRWDAAAKARLAAAASAPGARVAEIARRHGVSVGQLYAWRRAASTGTGPAAANVLVPVVIDDDRGMRASRGEIEIALAGDVRIMIRGTVDVGMLRAALAALRG